MARGDTGTVTVVSSGTAVQITSSIVTGQRVRASDKILVLTVTPRATNTGDAIYVGGSNKVSTSHGRRVPKGAEHTRNFEPGADSFNAWYVDADSSGDEIDWEVIFAGR